LLFVCQHLKYLHVALYRIVLNQSISESLFTTEGPEDQLKTVNYHRKQKQIPKLRCSLKQPYFVFVLFFSGTVVIWTYFSNLAV